MYLAKLSKEEKAAHDANVAAIIERRSKAPWNRPAPRTVGNVRELASHREFLDTQRAEEAAAERQRMAPAIALATENEQLLRQLHEAQKQALMTCPDVDIEFEVCKIRPEQYENLSFADWKKLAAEGFSRAQTFWQQEGIAPPTTEELKVVVLYFTTNGLLPSDEFAWALALQRCTEAGLLPDRLPAPVVSPAPETAPESVPQTNPYHPLSREGEAWDRRMMVDQACRELSPIFRGAVESLCSGGREMTDANMRYLFQKFSDSRLKLTHDNVRRVAFQIWGDECLDVMSDDERREYATAKADKNLSSDEYLRAHNLGNPRHHMLGTGRLSRGRS